MYVMYSQHNTVNRRFILIYQFSITFVEVRDELQSLASLQFLLQGQGQFQLLFIPTKLSFCSVTLSIPANQQQQPLKQAETTSQPPTILSHVLWQPLSSFTVLKSEVNVFDCLHLHFITGLEAFKSRDTYLNTGGDQGLDVWSLWLACSVRHQSSLTVGKLGV